MTIEEIKKNAPDGATHYFLVPNGSGDPYYVFKNGEDYYYAYSKDQILKTYILEWIKPL